MSVRMCPDEASKLILDDVFRGKHPIAVDPTSCPDYWLYRDLYHHAPVRFQITCGLHQNHPDDPLHISVTYYAGASCVLYHKLHLNVIWKKGVLRCYNITRKIYDRVDTIVEFDT